MRTLSHATLTMTLLATACGGDPAPQPAPAEPTPRVSILAQGAPMHGANGIRFDVQDRLHVASVFGREIIVMDPDSGEILERLGPEQGVEGPDDLTFGPDGSLYWTAIITGEVGRRTPDGRTQIIGKPGLGVNPIAMSGDGRLFVARCFFGDGFYEIDPEGVDEPREIIAQLGGGCGFNAFDFGPDGYLYAPGFFRDEIVRVDVAQRETISATQKIWCSGRRIPSALRRVPRNCCAAKPRSVRLTTQPMCAV